MIWHPIETAPKDGRKVLLYQDGNYAVCSWVKKVFEEQRLVATAGKRSTYEWVEVDASYWDGDDDLYEPTNWAELEPPK